MSTLYGKAEQLQKQIDHLSTRISKAQATGESAINELTHMKKAVTQLRTKVDALSSAASTANGADVSAAYSELSKAQREFVHLTSCRVATYSTDPRAPRAEVPYGSQGG